MKLNTLEKVAWSLEDMEHRVTVDAAVADGAKRAIDRMLDITP
jgi:quinolinate synthase